MKIGFIIHNVAETEVIDQLIEKYNVQNWTRIAKATGKCESADPVLDSKIWPGYFSMTIIEDKENLLDEIRNEIKKIKEHLKIPDLKYYEFETNYFI